MFYIVPIIIYETIENSSASKGKFITLIQILVKIIIVSRLCKIIAKDEYLRRCLILFWNKCLTKNKRIFIVKPKYFNLLTKEYFSHEWSMQIFSRTTNDWIRIYISPHRKYIYKFLVFFKKESIFCLDFFKSKTQHLWAFKYLQRRNLLRVVCDQFEYGGYQVAYSGHPNVFLFVCLFVLLSYRAINEKFIAQ